MIASNKYKIISYENMNKLLFTSDFEDHLQGNYLKTKKLQQKCSTKNPSGKKSRNKICCEKEIKKIDNKSSFF